MTPFDLARSLPSAHVDLVFKRAALRLRRFVGGSVKFSLAPMARLPHGIPAGWGDLLTADPREGIRRHWARFGRSSELAGQALAEAVTHTGLAATDDGYRFVYVILAPDASHQVFPFALLAHPPAARASSCADLDALLAVHEGLHEFKAFADMDQDKGVYPRSRWRREKRGTFIGRSFTQWDEQAYGPSELVQRAGTLEAHGQRLDLVSDLQQYLREAAGRWARVSRARFETKPMSSWTKLKASEMVGQTLSSLADGTLLVAQFPFAGRDPIYEVVSFHALLKVNAQDYRAYRAHTVDRALEGLRCAATQLDAAEALEELGLETKPPPRLVYQTHVRMK